MPLTNVNKLNMAVKNIKGEYYKLMSKRWGPRWFSGLRRSMVQGEQANQLNENIKRASQRWTNAQKKLDEALNKNANSLQAQKREIERTTAALYKNRNAAAKALENLNAKARRATNANEKAHIEKEKIPHKVVLKRFREKRNQINAERSKLWKNQSRLNKAINMRRRILTRKPTEAQARRTIGRSLSRTIVPRTLYGPFGTRTLTAMRQFPNYKEPTLEEYAEARRQINRLREALKRKRSPNSN